MSRRLALTLLFAFFILVLKTNAQADANAAANADSNASTAATDTTTPATDANSTAEEDGNSDMNNKTRPMCKKFDDTNTLAELQVFPKCNAEEFSEKILNTLRSFFNAYPFDEPKICRNETRKLLPELMTDLSKCLVGPCNETLFDTIVKEALEIEDYNAIKSVSTAQIRALLLPIARDITETVIEPFLTSFCVARGKKPLFLLLTPDDYTSEQFAQEFLQLIEHFVDMIFDRQVEIPDNMVDLDSEKCNEYSNMIQDAIGNIPQAFGTLRSLGAFSTLNSKAESAMMGILQQTPKTFNEQLGSDQKLNETLCGKRSFQSSENLADVYSTSMKMTAFSGIAFISGLVGFYML